MIKITSDVIIFIFFLWKVFADTDKCKAMSFEGGASKGAYQAGALQAFQDFLDPKEYSYQVVAGVSVGSLNALSFGLMQMGNESSSIKLLRDTWLSITVKDVFINWKDGGIIKGLLFESGIFDSSPERELIANATKQTTGHITRKVSYGTTDMDEGKFYSANDIMTDNTISQWAMCSSAIPLIFPYQICNNKIYSDGQTLISLDVFSPIELCQELGYSDENIIVDVLSLSMFKVPYINTTKLTSIEMVWRAISIHLVNKKRFALQDAKRYHPLVNWRYLVEPSRIPPDEILGFIPLDFNPKKLKETFDLGYNDTVNVIKNKTRVN